MSATPPQAASPDLTDIDLLLCPHCDYNMSGSESPVCPECGQPVNRESLTAWAMTTGTDLLPCPHLDGHPEAGLIAMSFFQPSRLGRLLSPRPDFARAYWFGMKMRGLSILPAGIAGLIVSDGAAAPILPASALGILVGSLIAEYGVVLVLKFMVTPAAVPERHTTKFWTCLCHCFSTHLVTSSCWFALWTLVGEALFHPAAALVVPLLFWLIPSLPILVWWICLSRAIRRRGLP